MNVLLTRRECRPTFFLFLLLFVFVSVQPNLAASSVATPGKIPNVSVPPVIDGKLDDTTWKKAFVIKSFTGRNGTGISETTTAYLLYDNDNLYVAFFCAESRMAEIQSDISVPDGPVYEDDCVEVFLDVDHNQKKFYHLMVNPEGTLYDAETVAGKTRLSNLKWRSRAQVGSASGKDFWTVEMAIPFDSMGVRPQNGTIWGMNLCREETPQKELSSWFPTVESFLDPALFGAVVFEGDTGPAPTAGGPSSAVKPGAGKNTHMY